MLEPFPESAPAYIQVEWHALAIRLAPETETPPEPYGERNVEPPSPKAE